MLLTSLAQLHTDQLKSYSLKIFFCCILILSDFERTADLEKTISNIHRMNLDFSLISRVKIILVSIFMINHQLYHIYIHVECSRQFRNRVTVIQLNEYQ